MNKVINTNFGLAQHKFRIFEAVVPADTKSEDVTKSETWANVAAQLQSGDEIRVRADDDSFVAQLYVSHRTGSEVRLHVLRWTQIEAIDHTVYEEENAPYFVRLQGQKKYCIIKRETGEAVKEGIPTKKQAYSELDDYVRALAA